MKRAFNKISLILLVSGIAALSCAVTIQNLFGESRRTGPTLYFVDPDQKANGKIITYDELFARHRADPSNKLPKNLVIITHGWFEDKPWPKEMALSIARCTEGSDFLCGWFDWQSEARVINPTDAARIACDEMAPMLAKNILNLSKDFSHIHFIAHSAGCWLISEAAKTAAEQTTASIHLTFLDAYVPPFWHEDNLGLADGDCNSTYWSDHYFTKDITFKTTEQPLTHSHNVDLTRVTPGVNDHEFPFYWYQATIEGRYDEKQRYSGRMLYYKRGSIDYGFDRSMEKGAGNWAESIKLPMGNPPEPLFR